MRFGIGPRPPGKQVVSMPFLELTLTYFNLISLTMSFPIQKGSPWSSLQTVQLFGQVEVRKTTRRRTSAYVDLGVFAKAPPEEVKVEEVRGLPFLSRAFG